MSSLKIILSGGGTGGHIFPAIAIANAIKNKRPDTEFLFVGAKDKMEMQKVPQAGYKIEGLWISGFQRSLSLKNLLFPFKLFSSMVRAHNIVHKFKPDVAVGTGGFASGPLLRAASSNNVPTVIQEQNSFPGITNRFLGPRAKKICVAYEGMGKYFQEDKLVLTGNPVRKEVVQLEGKKSKALTHFGLNEEQPIVLVIGGSLGAQSINRALAKQLNALVEAGVQLLWQTGKTTFAESKQAASAFEQKGVKVHEFIYEMDLAYAVADVVISRAGAIAVSELCLVQKPAVFVPFPHAAEDHQTKNAMALVEKDAGILVKDELAEKELVSEVLSLVKDEERKSRIKENMKQLGYADAANQIADEIIALAEK